ncbi:MAG: trypsin-like peptidase domain-containing protein [Saprospiraceae bacterium]|nr:trypsin-like peptidase domain-containing protein [Saprospiraceae bacterium]
MKNIFSNLLAGLIGGLLVAATAYFYLPEYLTMHENPNEKAMHVNNESFVNRLPSPNTGPDFTLAASKALEVVVQINAQESEQKVRQKEQRYFGNDPFFNHPMFRDFFGYGFQPQKGSGSGVIISNDGYIVTNNHVVEFADDIEVILKSGKKFKASKIGTDPRTDLAVLKIEENGLPVLPMANSDLLKVGEWVLAVGNPFGYLTSTVTAGIVSAKGRDLNIIDDNRDYSPYYGNPANPSQKGIEEFIQTDAAINPGNSGGALVDGMGRLVGINSAIATKTGYFNGYSFAIPVNLMNKIVKELIANGNFERGRLGVVVSEIDENYLKELNLSSKDGVVIEELEDNSSAKYAGLRPKDVIIGVNGKSVKNYDDLIKEVGLTKVGETIQVKIIRDGSSKEIPVKIRKGL